MIDNPLSLRGHVFAHAYEQPLINEFVGRLAGGLLQANRDLRALVAVGVVSGVNKGDQLMELISGTPGVGSDRVVRIGDVPDTLGELTALAGYVLEHGLTEVVSLCRDRHDERIRDILAGHPLSAIAGFNLQILTTSRAVQMIPTETAGRIGNLLTHEDDQRRSRYDGRVHAIENWIGPQAVAGVSAVLTRYGLKGFSERVMQTKLPFMK